MEYNCKRGDFMVASQKIDTDKYEYRIWIRYERPRMWQATGEDILDSEKVKPIN